jgi:hypothetical protein
MDITTLKSLLFSLCCLAAAVGTAVDAGTERG